MHSHARKNLLGNLLLSAGALVFSRALLSEPNFSPIAGSIIRALCNLIVAIFLSRFLRDPLKDESLWGKNYFFLLIWGFFGSLTLLSYFTALKRLGAGSAGFLINTSGFFLVFIGAWFNKRQPQKIEIIAGLLCLFGAGLLALEDGPFYLGTGLIFGLASGLSAALAYTLVGGRIMSESTFSMMFYWSLVSVFVHGLILLRQSIAWPQQNESWLFLIASGTLASLGQYWVTASYQTKDSSKIGVISYFGCLISMVLEVICLGKHYSFSQYGGAAVIFCAGVWTIFSIGSNKINSKIGVYPRSE